MSLDWNLRYLECDTPWEKGEPAPPLLEWLEANPRGLTGTGLVPGCGLGHDARPLAAVETVDAVVGLDISPRAIELAESLEKTGKEKFLVGDLFDLDPSHLGAYDWVWEHTCFCAIDPGQRDDYVAAVRDVLEPGGTLLAVFFIDPYDEDHRPGEGPPFGVDFDELTRRFTGDGSFRIEEAYVPRRAFPGREECELVMRLTKTEENADS